MLIVNKLRTWICAVAVFVVFGAVALAYEPIETKRPNIDVIRVAHRGASKFAPENTVPAIQKALEIGMNYIELDVRYTTDGVPVLMHDDTVNRTTTGSGPINQMSLAEVKKLRAVFGMSRDASSDVEVPTLEEALIAMGPGVGAYIDQKETPQPILLELLKKYDKYPHLTVIVGGGQFTADFAKLDPLAPAMPGIGSVEDIQPTLEKFPNARAFNTSAAIITNELVDAAHARGIMVFTNTLGWDDRDTAMKKAIFAGVDAIQTDHPDVLVSTVKKFKAKAESMNKP